MTDVEGTVYWDTGGTTRERSRVGHGIIRYTNGAKVGLVETDDDGDFTLPSIDESESLSLVVLHQDGQALRTTYESGAYNGALDLRLFPQEGPTSQRIGLALLGSLIVALGILTYVYFSAHQESERDAETQYAALQEALHQVPLDKSTVTANLLATAQAKVRTARAAISTLRSHPSEELDRLLIQIIAFELDTSAQNINRLEALVSEARAKLSDTATLFFWSAWPWRLVEIWSWGLLGVLLSKIVRIGWYLRASTYLARGTWMHIAHVIATPFLALIAVLFLSFLKIEGEFQTIAEFDSPLLTVLIASLLSTNPWGLWDFVLGQGERLRHTANDS